MEKKDLLVIGAGVAGMTAALYARRAGYSVALFDKNMYGGQVSITPTIENYPGIAKIDGASFAMGMYDQISSLGAEVIFDQVLSVELEGPVKTVVTANGRIEGRALIIANGVERRKLGCPGEEKFAGRGVSYCATCDGSLYRDKRTVVVGGGNTALEDALYLSGICQEVHIVHRRNVFRGEARLSEAVLELRKKNVVVHWNSQIQEIQGEQTVTGVVLQDSEGNRTELETSAVFVAVGLLPVNQMFSSLPLTEQGYFDVGEDCRTPIPGVFVAGDTRGKPLRQIVTAAADGAVAASQAGIYLRQGTSETSS